MTKTRYAVVDLETTGTNYQEENRIIQIGCAFVENGKVIDTFHSKVNPQRPIPTEITKLTGITDEQVKNAPKFNDIASEIYRRLVDTTFVAHNVDFDFPFINEELVRSGYPELEIPAIDTVALSQVVFSYAKGYRLRDLTSYLKIEHHDPHSADSDAVATAHLLIEIQNQLQKLPIVTLDRLATLSEDLPRETHQLIKDVLRASKLHPGKLNEDLVVVNGMALQKAPSLATGDQIDVTLNKYPHAKKDKIKLYQDHLTWRKTQGTLMNYIHQQFTDADDRKNIVIEAPTGIGKTLGYLLPLSYIARQEQRQAVISVPTTVLQGQLLTVGEKQLNQILETPVQFALLKGSSNYLSLDLFNKILDQGDLSKESKLIAMKLLVWLTKTTTGDLDEINYHFGFSNFIDDVRHRGNTGLNDKSAFYEVDFYRRARAKLKFADFIITNHMYLAQHGSEISHQERKPLLVIDEAQHFITDLTSTNQKYIDLNALMMETHRLVSHLVMNRKHNLIYATKHQPLAAFHIRRFANSLESINTLIMRVQKQLYDQFVPANQQHLVKNQPGEIAIDNQMVEELNRNEFHQITQELANTFIEFDALDKHFKSVELDDDTKQNWFQIKAFQGNLTQFYDAIRLMNQSQDQNICWITLGPNHDAGSIRIGRGIVNTGDFYQNRIEPYYHKVLLIGGTLFVGQNRSYFLDQYQLDKSNSIVRSFNTGVNFSGRLNFEILNTKFTLNANTSTKEYEQYLADSITELTNGVDRQTLVLFNSLETIKGVYSLLRQNGLTDQRRILAQGIHGSRPKIIREFNDEDNAILLGAASFWEGVDFPGDRLEYLIVTRLPFRSPDDKLVQFAAKKRPDVFQHFMLPDALLTFKQGLGRVIRNSEDTGAVVLLDNRILTRKYGKQFVNQLPNGVEANVGNVEEVKKRTDNFFNGMK
jgi:ATP-dependent DNA helicase DinG